MFATLADAATDPERRALLELTDRELAGDGERSAEVVLPLLARPPARQVAPVRTRSSAIRQRVFVQRSARRASCVTSRSAPG
jgi:hypothetical protein